MREHEAGTGTALTAIEPDCRLSDAVARTYRRAHTLHPDLSFTAHEAVSTTAGQPTG